MRFVLSCRIWNKFQSRGSQKMRIYLISKLFGTTIKCYPSFLSSFAFKSRMPNAASCGHDGLRVLAAPLSAPSIGHSSSAWCIVDGGNQAAKGSGRKLRYRGRKRRKAWKMAARREGNKGGGNGFIKTIPVARGA